MPDVAFDAVIREVLTLRAEHGHGVRRLVEAGDQRSVEREPRAARLKEIKNAMAAQVAALAKLIEPMGKP